MRRAVQLEAEQSRDRPRARRSRRERLVGRDAVQPERRHAVGGERRGGDAEADEEQVPRRLVARPVEVVAAGEQHDDQNGETSVP